MSEFQFPEEFHFLNEMLGNRAEQYESAPWLQNDFSDHIWEGRFEDYSNIRIDFNVRLDDGTFLTENKNSELLKIFKSWICIQTHFDAGGGSFLAPGTSYNRVCKTLHLIDYLLLNSKSFQLSKHGLKLISANDIVGVIHCIASHNDINLTVYNWRSYLENFLLDKVKELREEELLRAQEELPSIIDLDLESDRFLINLNASEILKARAWLWINGYYKTTKSNGDFRYSPSTQKLAQQIYPNTLWGKIKKLCPKELEIEPMERYFREYPKAPSRNYNDSRQTERGIASYSGALRRLGLLAEFYTSIPVNSLQVLDNQALKTTLNLKAIERTKNIPPDVIFPTLRKAIEYCLTYGDEIMDSTLAIFIKAKSLNMSCEVYCRMHGIKSQLSPGLLELGIEYWSLKQEMSFIECNPRKLIDRLPKSDYFLRMRKNQGFFQLLLVYFGAVQVITGTLMARRQGELMDLNPSTCMDKSERHLIFFNRKTGAFGYKNKEARPMPALAVKLIKQIIRLQEGLIQIEVLKKHTSLFSTPLADGSGLTKMSSRNFNKAIDHFCDYFQIPTNSHGERFYFRQHQMRRFFAMLFFWSGSFGSMDTLRWFLGHTDVQHLYHYITESISGEVLRSVHAQFATHQIKIGADGTKPLQELLLSRFGTIDFQVLDSEELDEYITVLLEDGQVNIEPEFLEDSDGNSYRILIKVVNQEYKNG